MADLDDIEDVFNDIEDIVEEIADPDDLLEDFSADPLTVAVGLIAGLAGLFTLFMLLLLTIFVAFQFGLMLVILALTMLGFLVTLGAIGAFIYVRSGLPSHLRRKVADAECHAAESDEAGGPMSEEEAIEELKDRYAAGEISDHEFEEALDDILSGGRNEEVLHEYE
jgi:hypothetical protein